MQSKPLQFFFFFAGRARYCRGNETRARTYNFQRRERRKTPLLSVEYCSQVSRRDLYNNCNRISTARKGVGPVSRCASHFCAKLNRRAASDVSASFFFFSPTIAIFPPHRAAVAIYVILLSALTRSRLNVLASSRRVGRASRAAANLAQQ